MGSIPGIFLKLSLLVKVVILLHDRGPAGDGGAVLSAEEIALSFDGFPSGNADAFFIKIVVFILDAAQSGETDAISGIQIVDFSVKADPAFFLFSLYIVVVFSVFFYPAFFDRFFCLDRDCGV